MNQMTKNRWLGLAGLLVVGLLLGTNVLAPAQDKQSPGETESKQPVGANEGPGLGSERLREGSQFKGRIGRFEITGDRVTFFPSDKNANSEGEEQYRVLENLALERVVRVLNDTRTRRQWNVSGLITEFQGANYLLVRRAFITSSTTAQKPAR